MNFYFPDDDEIIEEDCEPFFNGEDEEPFDSSDDYSREVDPPSVRSASLLRKTAWPFRIHG
jgi:hypothetical protein